MATVTLLANGTVTTGTSKAQFSAPEAGSIDSVTIACSTAPTGAALIADVNIAGTTIFTTQGNRPTIAIAGFDATAGTAANSSFAAGDIISMDIDQVGSTVAGANVTAFITYSPASASGTNVHSISVLRGSHAGSVLS